MPDDQTGRFLFVCLPKRREVYEPLLREVKQPIQFLDDGDQALESCVLCPPLALLADVVSLAHIGHQEVAWLSNVNVAWPVIRCNVNSTGQAVAMCNEPAYRGPIADALSAIAAGQAAWGRPRYRRQHLRVDLFCRARLLQPSADPKLTNTLDISSGGLFVLSHQEIAAGSELDVELWDLAQTPLQLCCRVAHFRRWTDGPRPPGLGLTLIGGHIADFRQALTTPANISRFRRLVS